MRLDMQFFKSVIKEAIVTGNTTEEFRINIDSRQIKKGEIFLALKGNKVDGHDFIKEAVNTGAIGIIINSKNNDCLKKLDKKDLNKIFVVQVPDTYETLLRLAQEYRLKFDCPIIGITGSIGKTSTKEILSNILKAADIDFIASIGNQNTAIGASLNILRMKEHHKIAVFELGISKRNEMTKMAEIVKPTMAVITYIGHSHMEGLGSLTDIANEKREIFKYFKENNIGIINGDLPILANISYNHPVIKFGFKTTNQIQARKIQTNSYNSSFLLKLYKNKYKINLDTTHIGRINNILASVTVANLLDINHEQIIKGIQLPVSISGRFEHTNLKSRNGFTPKGILINDCYNASPESMKAALLAFEKLDSKGQKIAVIGDMLELGVNSPFWHRQIGRFLRKVPSLNHVVLVGDLVKWTKTTLPFGLSFEHVADWKMALECLKSKINKESTILVKGSLGMSLGNLVKELT